MKAIWNDQVIAESDDTVVVEGNHYFPAESLRRELFAPSSQKSVCPWKGEASYYDIVVDGAASILSLLMLVDSKGTTVISAVAISSLSTLL